MLRITLKSLFVLCLATVFASCSKDDETPRFTVTFESLDTGKDGFWKGADKSGKFVSEKVTFPNNFNEKYGSWSGFSYSKLNDKKTKGYGNQFSVFANGGANGSSNFAIGFIDPKEENNTIKFSGTAKNVKLKTTVGTYTYFDLKEGSKFTKKFGGESGNDKDYLKLTCIGLDAAGKETGTVDIFLADYRFEDNSKDYIITEWAEFNLTGLGEVSAIKFKMSSTDNGKWGMNTPAYYFLDDISYE